MTYLAVLTIAHTAISFVALAFGVPAVVSLFGRKRLRPWRGRFLATAAATTISGFLFPFNGPTPAFLVGIVATVILIAVALADRRRDSRVAQWIFAVGLVASLHLLVFVAIAQAFLKVPALKQLAPTGSEPAFAITQLIALLAFIGLGIAALRAGRSSPVRDEGSTAQGAASQ